MRVDPTFEVPYDHPSLEPVLCDTLGTIIFQDQVIEVAMAFAGFSPGEAEGLRRLTINCGYDPETIAIGASIACSGICLTVVSRGRKDGRGAFSVESRATPFIAWRSPWTSWRSSFSPRSSSISNR